MYLFNKDISKTPYLQAIDRNKWFILIVIALSVLYVLPIILANTYYIDDMNRTVAGYNWDHDGRFVSSKLMNVLSFQSEVVYSLYPYSQMISAVLLSLSGFIICYTIGIRNKTLLIIGSLLLTTCPFLLEILSYRFDCLPISLSVLLVTIPFIFYNKKKWFVISSIICITMCLGLYQTSAMSYGTILCLFLIKDVWYANFKNAFFYVIIGAAAFLLAFLLYNYIVELLDLTIKSKKRGEFIFKDKNVIYLLHERFNSMLQLLKVLVSSSYRYVLYFLMFMSALNVIVLFIKKRKEVVTIKFKFIIQLIVTVVLLLCVCVLTSGVNLFVYEPRWVPRGMIGWCVFIYLFYFTFTLYRVKKAVILLSFIPFIYYSFLISSQLGLYLKNQDDFSDHIISLLSPKLLEYGELKLVIEGQNRPAFRNHTINENTIPIIYELAPIYEDNGWMWGVVRLNKFGSISSTLVRGDERNSVISQKSNMSVIQENKFYTLYIKQPYALVEFK